MVGFSFVVVNSSFSNCLGEYGGGSSEEEEEQGKERYKVCTQIENVGNVGNVVVVVVVKEEEEEEGEEESGEGSCIVGMEEEEVNGEVDGEGVMVDMGNELTKVLSECEDIQIVMNITVTKSNG